MKGRGEGRGGEEEGTRERMGRKEEDGREGLESFSFSLFFFFSLLIVGR